MKEISILALAVAGLILLLFAGCRGKSVTLRAAGASTAPVVVETWTVASVDAPQYLDVTGTVSPQLSADVSTRTQGRITQVLVDTGDAVRRGQPLVSLDAADLDSAVAESSSALHASQVQYQSSVAAAGMARATSSAQIEAARSQVRQAQATLATAIAKRDLVDAGPRRQEREEAAQDAARANASLVLAQKTYDRMSSLFKYDAITAQQLDISQSDLNSAQAAYQSAVQHQSMVDEGSRIEEKAAADAAVAQAQAGLEAARASLAEAVAGAQVVGVREADVRVAAAQIGQAQANLSGAVSNRSYATVVAPFDGVVSQRLADPGAMAGPGVPLLQIEGGVMRLDLVVPASAIGVVRVGSSVPVSIDASPHSAMTATVISISPQGDADSHTFIVRLQLPKDSGARAGMYGRARIRTGIARELTAPSSAVVSREGLDYVYVVANGLAQLRLVSTGSTYGDDVEILSGLQPGETVAISNIDALADNESVRVAAAQESR